MLHRCLDCALEYTGTWNQKRCKDCQRKHHNEKTRLNYHNSDKQYRIAQSAAWRAANPEKVRRYRVKGQRLAMGCIDATDEIKAGPCESCGDFLECLHFDHDHATGLFRGWLCSCCNTAIGLLKDDPQRAINAANYLIRTKKK